MEGKRSSAGQLLLQKKVKPKLNKKKINPKGNTILKLKLLSEHKHSSHRLGLSRTEAVQVQHTLINGDTPTHHLKIQKGIR